MEQQGMQERHAICLKGDSAKVNEYVAGEGLLCVPPLNTG